MPPYSDPDKKRAYQKAYSKQPHVMEARRENFRKWAEDNRDHLKARAAERRLTKRALCLIATTRTRARKRKLAFDLARHAGKIQARIDRGVCEVTGVPFDLSPGRKFNSPSLDRIDPKAGYTYGNVRVVLNLVNAALGDWGEKTLRGVMAFWLQSTRGSRRNSSAQATKPFADYI